MEPKDQNSTDSNASLDSNLTDANASGPPADAPEVAPEPTWLDGVMQRAPWECCWKGAPFMWPILILAIVGLAVVIERFRA